MNIKINGETKDLGDLDSQTPLLWVLRDELNLVGTKYGCGISQCGACTILVDNVAVKSCSYPVASVGNAEVTTIEGLAGLNGELNAVQKAWVDLDVAQCGYCQSGQVMAAEALLRENPNPSDEEIDQAMATNICRCGTYVRIREAIKTAATQLATEAGGDAR
ncbi:MAG: (2Fe-2S)-binding protein [Gammaproteobacteria bacterium]|nr:(2Fe-2S)-binding protein [Gammaproteobacteria bacterium]